MTHFVGFAKEIKDTLGVEIKKLNAGGGYGIAYTHEDHPLDFEVITSAIMKTIQEGFAKNNMRMPMVLIEPGRFVVGNAGITLYQVTTSAFAMPKPMRSSPPSMGMNRP